MNYDYLEYIKNGVIIEKLSVGEMVYINKVGRKLLGLNSGQKIKTMFQLLEDSKSFLELHNKICKELKLIGKCVDSIYLKSLDDFLIEVEFVCTWIDEENDLVSYVFQDASEVAKNNHIKFHEVAEFLPSGVIVMDVEDDLSLTYANAEHYKMLGVDIDEEGKNKKEISTFLADTIYEEDKDWVMAEIYDNLHKEKDVDVEFRMKAHGDQLKWVRLFGRAKKSSNGNIMFYSSLKDLSNRREINDKLHLERVLFHKMTEMTDEILFRLDLKTKILHFLGSKFTNTFNSEPVMEEFPSCVTNTSVIYEEDLPIFESMLNYFKKGEVKVIELRLNMPDDTVQWHEILYNFVKSSDEEPLLVVGKLINIQKQKWLEEQAKIDLLTGFLNKINTAMEVNRLLMDPSSLKSKHALFIIDIDNFKGINDNLGHHFGDIVLHDIARDISKCFRKGDILGRIGGDEFIVVMKDYLSMDNVKEKAVMICNALEKTFLGQAKSYNISASIGVSIYPENGKTYEMLYQMADIALYKTKEYGKNNFTMYSDDLANKKHLSPSKIHKSNRHTETFIDTTVIASVFNLLYETNDIRLSLNTIVEYLCRNYKVDRCYIFQTIDSGNIYSNEYQWSTFDGLVKEENIQYLKYEDLMSIFNIANEDGVLAINDFSVIEDEATLKIIEDDKIKSIFLVESLKEGERKAFFGMDDCTKKREWTPQEVRTLFHVARIIFGSLTGYNIIKNLQNKIVELES